MIGAAPAEAPDFQPVKDPSAPRGFKLPGDLRSAVVALRAGLSESALQRLRLTPEDELVGRYHHALGQWIRNYWLYEDSPLLDDFRTHGVSEPDSASGILIRALWRELNGISADLDGLLAQAAYEERIDQTPPNTECPTHPGIQMKSLFMERRSGADGRSIAVHYAFCPHDSSFWVFQHEQGWKEATDHDLEVIQRVVSIDDLR